MMMELNETEIITVSPSQYSLYKQCPYAWHLNYVEKIKRKGTKQHFEIGTYTHDLFHIMFQLIEQGMEPGSHEMLQFMADRIQEDFADIVARYEVEESFNAIEMMSKVTGAVTRYIRQQSAIIDAGITPVGVEFEMMVKIDDLEVNGKQVYAHGFIDLLYRKRRSQGLWIRDHKTGGNPASHSLAKVEANSQLLFYNAWLDYAGFNIEGVEISFIHTDPPKNGKNAFGHYPFQHNAKSLADYRDQVRRAIVKMYSEPAERVRSDSCTSCSYWNICKHEVRGISTNGIRRELYEPVKRPLRLATGN